MLIVFRHMTIVLLIGAVMSLNTSRVFGNSQRNPVGTVVEIRGIVYLLHDDKSKPLRLDPKRDRNRQLYAGEKVRCGKHGVLRIQLYEKPLQIRQGTWYPIPFAPHGLSPKLLREGREATKRDRDNHVQKKSVEFARAAQSDEKRKSAKSKMAAAKAANSSASAKGKAKPKKP